MTTALDTGRKQIGDNHPSYFIADIGANYDGDIERAKSLIHLCAEAGADAVKFQNFKARTIVSDFGFKTMGGKQSHQSRWRKSVLEVYEDASLPVNWSAELKETADEANVDYFTTPYDLDLIALLEPYVCAWKLGSGDITWHEEIELLARQSKPIFIATGASTLAEVRLAMDVASRHTDQICLLQCNTNYTGSLDNFRHIALNVLKVFGREFPGTVLGLSDHTPGHATVLGAVALGAKAIEKHFTDDTSRIGPDHGFAMDPKTWRDMVDRTRELEAALGTEEKMVMENEQETVIVQRRAVRAKHDLPEGCIIAASDLEVLRPCPADALPPYRIDEVIGRTAGHAIAGGDIVRPGDVS